MKSVAIIPARSGSVRVPNKNSVDLGGRPMIGWPISAAVRAGCFDTVHVSTDSPRIAEISRQFGASADFFRAPAMCTDEVPLRKVLAWVLDEFARRGEQFDAVCLVYATAAFVTDVDLKESKRIFVAHGTKYPVISVVQYPAPVQWALLRGPGGLIVPRNPEAIAQRSQTFEPYWYEAAMFLWFAPLEAYVERPDFPFPAIPYEVPRERGIDIDTPEDLAFAQTMARYLLADQTQ
jgi:N-acylneuraminate cytidylyltransferase